MVCFVGKSAAVTYTLYLGAQDGRHFWCVFLSCVAGIVPALFCTHTAEAKSSFTSLLWQVTTSVLLHLWLMLSLFLGYICQRKGRWKSYRWNGQLSFDHVVRTCCRYSQTRETPHGQQSDKSPSDIMRVSPGLGCHSFFEETTFSFLPQTCHCIVFCLGSEDHQTALRMHSMCVFM